jgi:regulator of replication initiation timing
LKPLPEAEKIVMCDKCEPIPRSMDQLRQEHQEEEEENKKREIEARLAQKRLEEEKSRLRYEQQQQIAKQEQNTAALKVYFEAMNLGFHTGEEDFNASMSVLSIYH